MKPIPLSLCLAVALSLATAHADDWTTVTSGWRPSTLIPTEDAVWAASDGGLVAVNRTTRDLVVYNVDDGLFSNFPTIAELDEPTGYLWIGYGNAGIDVFDPARRTVVQTIRDFRSSQSVQTVHDIYAGEEGVFVATDQGLSRLRQVEDEDLWVVQETYRGFGAWPRPTGITDVEVHEGRVFAGSAIGVAEADLDANLLDAGNWAVTPVSDFIPGEASRSIRRLTQTGGTLFVSYSGTALWSWDGGWSITNTPNGPFGVISTASGVSYLAMYNGLFRRLPNETGYTQLAPDFDARFQDVAIDEDGMVWGAVDTDNSYFGGIARWDGSALDVYYPNTPGGDQALNAAISPEGEVWLAARGSSIVGTFVYADDVWYPWAKANAPHAPWTRGNAINVIEFDNYGGTWIGTWGNSAYYVRPLSNQADSLFYFAGSTSPLAGVNEGDSYIVVNGAEPDPDGGFWLSNMAAWDNYTLLYIPEEWFLTDPENWDMSQWVRYGPTDGNRFTYLSQIEIDSQGRLWMTSLFQDPDEFVAVLDPNGSPEDPSDDTWYYREAFTTDIEFETVNALAMGDDDILWFGTRDGLYYADASLPIDQVVFTRVNGALGQSINALTIDPLGQIWVGTDFGISVLGRDRFSWIAQYTSEDGPHPSGLVDDQVTALAIHPGTGDAYIGTNAGLSVLRTPYREFGSEVGDMVVAPQPFVIGNPGERLRFGSESLVTDAEVRFFTPSGRLVRTLNFETASGSGWDGRDDDGEWVGSGVYYILVTGPDGASHTGKVAVVRQ